MARIRLPLVGNNTSLGEAARTATEAKVGAVIVASMAGLWILPIMKLPKLKNGLVGGLLSSLSKQLEESSNVRSDFKLVSINDGLAEIEFDENHPWQINLVYGFKECDVNRRHTYPPTYPGKSCSPPCTGKLLKKP